MKVESIVKENIQTQKFDYDSGESILTLANVEATIICDPQLKLWQRKTKEKRGVKLREVSQIFKNECN